MITLPKTHHLASRPDNVLFIYIMLTLYQHITIFSSHNTNKGGVIGMFATPVGAAIGAGVGALIGGGCGLVGGAVGAGGAGLGITHRMKPISHNCSAEDIFKHLEMSSNYKREGSRVIVEITGNFTCKESVTHMLINEAGLNREQRHVM